MNDETIDPEFRPLLEQLADAFDDARLEPIPPRLSAAAHAHTMAARRRRARRAAVRLRQRHARRRARHDDRSALVPLRIGRLPDQGPSHRRVADRHDRAAAVGGMHRRQRRRSEQHRTDDWASSSSTLRSCHCGSRWSCPAATSSRLGSPVRDHGLTTRKMAGGTPATTRSGLSRPTTSEARPLVSAQQRLPCRSAG